MSTPFDPLAPWDRQTRLVEPSSEYMPGLYRFNEYAAGCILRDRSVPLNNWEAQFLQGVVYRPRQLSDVEKMWLAKLERRAAGKVAA